MTARRAETLARIHRVRTVQLGLARADAVRAGETLASEHALTQRIVDLAAAVAPAPELTGALALAAAAQYRDRLSQTADAVRVRVETAERRAALATEASHAARRDESAVEKLIARARTAMLQADMRALQNAAPQTKPKRHDPC